jgi:hypothetical protein
MDSIKQFAYIEQIKQENQQVLQGKIVAMNQPLPLDVQLLLMEVMTFTLYGKLVPVLQILGIYDTPYLIPQLIPGGQLQPYFLILIMTI